MHQKQTAYSWETEHRLAAEACGYRWDEFVRLPGDPWAMDDRATDCKAAVIALYRIKQVLEAMDKEAGP